MRLDEVILRLPRASQPAAATVPPGTLCYIVDEQKTERSTGSAWETYSDASSGASAPAGPPNAVQFNNAGVVGGSADMVFDTASGQLQVKSVSVQAYLGFGTWESGPGVVYGKLEVVHESTYVQYLKADTAAGTVTLGSNAVIVNAPLNLQGGTQLVTTQTALTDGAGTETATLTNAPISGNPTKWIAIHDAGTIRYLPVW